jgi:hypothetical protein
VCDCSVISVSSHHEEFIKGVFITVSAQDVAFFLFTLRPQTQYCGLYYLPCTKSVIRVV